MTGVAKKVTPLPRQNGFAEATMVTLTGRFGFTVMVTGGLVAGLPVMQLAEEIIIQVTRSPVAGVYVNTELFAPAFTPLTFHW